MNKSTNTKIYRQKLASKKRSIRNGTRRKIKKEPETTGTSVRIPELRMSVKLRVGNTLENWIIVYCENNPLQKTKLYTAYNIPLS